MHMAQPPVEHERRVMYSGFALPPLGGGRPGGAWPRPGLGAAKSASRAPLTVLDRHFKS